MCKPVLNHVAGAWLAGQITSGLTTGEGIIYHVRDAAGEDDPGVADKRRLFLETELATAFARMKREGNTLSAVLRQAWDGQRLALATKSQPYTASGVLVSVIGHITAEEVARVMDSVEEANGLANRFLWLAAKRTQALPETPMMPEELWRGEADAIASVLRKLRARPGPLGCNATGRPQSCGGRITSSFPVFTKPAPGDWPSC